MHAATTTTTTTATTARVVSWPGSTLEQGRELHRTPMSISADSSLTGPLMMGKDSIGQFERERALARGEKGVFGTSRTASTTTTTTTMSTTTTGDSGILRPPTAATASAASLATTVRHSSSCMRCSSGSVVFVASSAAATTHAGKGGQGERGQGGGTWTAIQCVDFEPSLHNDDVGSRSRSRGKSNNIRHNTTTPIVSVGKGPRTWAGLFGFPRGTPPPLPSTPPASHYDHRPTRPSSCKKSQQGRHLSSGYSDISEKWMLLPEPSRFEGMCSNRGMIIKMTTMVLILCGLVLLVLGFTRSLQV